MFDQIGKQLNPKMIRNSITNKKYIFYYCIAIGLSDVYEYINICTYIYIDIYLC